VIISEEIGDFLLPALKNEDFVIIFSSVILAFFQIQSGFN